MDKYYVIDEKNNPIEIDVTKIKWNNIKPYYFGGKIICKGNPDECIRSFFNKKNARQGCRDSKTCHFCKHPLHGFEAEEWNNIFTDDSKKVITSKEGIEELFNNNDDNALEQYENVGLGVIKQSNIIYKQLRENGTKLCFWGKDDGRKNYKGIMVITDLDRAGVKKIVTIFKPSHSKYNKIHAYATSTPQYKAIFEGNNSTIMFLVTPPEDKYKSFIYYEDKVFNKISQKLCSHFQYDTEYISNFNMMLHLQQKLEDSIIIYRNDKNYETLFEVVQNYLLYKNYEYTKTTFREYYSVYNEQQHNWVFGEKIDDTGYYYNALGKRHRLLLHGAESLLDGLKNDRDFDGFIRSKFQKLAQVDLDEFEFYENSLNTDDIENTDDDYYYDLLCFNLALDIKLYNYLIEIRTPNDISNQLELMSIKLSNSKLFKPWKDLIDNLWV